jgi:hypothetical protein
VLTIAAIAWARSSILSVRCTARFAFIWRTGRRHDSARIVTRRTRENVVIAHPLLRSMLAAGAIAAPVFAHALDMTTPTTEIAIELGGQADVSVTFHNGAAVATPELSIVLGTDTGQPMLQYEQLPVAGCGDVQTDSGTIAFTLAPIDAGGEHTCTIRVSRGNDVIDSQIVDWRTATSGTNAAELTLAIGTFAGVQLSAELESRTIDGGGIHSVLRLGAHNGGAVAIDAQTSVFGCHTDPLDHVVSGACEIVPGDCSQTGAAPTITWASVAAGADAQCEIATTTQLIDYDKDISLYVSHLSDTDTGGEVFLPSDAFELVSLHTVVADVAINQYGLSGSWANAETPAQGFVVNMQPNVYGQGEALLFAGWFTYDVNAAGGQRWYTIQGQVDGSLATAPIYRTDGGRFDSPQATNTVRVGSATLTFADCSHGVLIYSFDDGSGRAGAIPITRLLSNVSCNAAGDGGNAAPSYDLEGTWADPSNSGQGLVIDIDPTHNILFAAWYTFTPLDGQFGSARQRWFTLQGDKPSDPSQPVNVTLYESHGGVFNAPASATTVAVGSASITQTSCTTATMSYRFTSGENLGRTGTLALSRLGSSPPGCGL